MSDVINRALSRRQVLIGAASTAALTVVPALRAAPSRATKMAPRRALDLTKPADNVLAYLKMRASTVTQDVYYWFTGRLDLAVAGMPIKPFVNVESLILRRTEKLGDLQWNVIDWEASYYRDANTGAVIEGEIENPHTGKMVRPIPYTEGPVRFRFTDQEPRIIGSRDVMPKTGKPFNYPWKIVDGDVWMTKSSYIKAPNWLDPAQWPLESSGKDLIVATQSTLRARLADVENPAMASVPTAFSYSATSSWQPWMQMGQTPGFLIWSEFGKKLFSLDQAPAEQVATLHRFHPQWFGRPEPWPEFTNMYLQYKANHQPAAPANIESPRP